MITLTAMIQPVCDFPSREYQLVQDQFGFTEEHLRELARKFIRSVLLAAEKKLAFLNSFDAV